MPGRRPVVRERIARVLSDSSFDINPADQGAVTAYSLARLLKVRLETVPAGRDSTRVAVTGEIYVGDTARRDSISGLPERWRLITAGDGGSVMLRELARSLRSRPETLRGAAGHGAARHAPETVSVAPARSALPTAAGSGTPADSEVAERLAQTPIGRSVEVCRSAWVPTGWLVLYWRVDPSRCQGLPDTRFAGEPNVMRIEREW